MPKGIYNRKTRTVEDRFWEKVTKTDGCWLWTGCIVNGYGRFNTGHGPRYAHIVSWELHYGPVPGGMCVCHSCDNPSCIRPGHFFLGTKTQNFDDMRAKGRQSKGESVSKLATCNVLTIREMYATGHFTLQVLADVFGTTMTNVHAIVSRRSWKHI